MLLQQNNFQGFIKLTKHSERTFAHPRGDRQELKTNFQYSQKEADKLRTTQAVQFARQQLKRLHKAYQALFECTFAHSSRDVPELKTTAQAVCSYQFAAILP